MGASTEEATALRPYPHAHETHLVIIETPYGCRPNWSHCQPEDPLGLGSLDEHASESKNQFIWFYSQMPNHLNPEDAATAVLLGRGRSNS